MSFSKQALACWSVLLFTMLGCGGDKGPKKIVPCGNGEIDPGETCDPGILTGEGSCPSSCEASSDPCLPMVIEGVAGRCNAECVTVAAECGTTDQCCPAGCGETDDADCAPMALCGNGRLDSTETCDPGISSGLPGSCECLDTTDACTENVTGGDPSRCNITCETRPVTECASGDGCCPAGCNGSTDADCGDVCGDGVVGPTETCDGDCPTNCDDGNACTFDNLNGSPGNCNSSCTYDVVTACTGGDGCCPANCDPANDSDCSATCGNGVVENGETCDGACPSSCDDSVSCTLDTMTGSPATCNVQCTNNPIVACVNGDGCCPGSCTAANDTDCNSVCGNGVIEGGETCDGNCPSSCNDFAACTTDVMSGSSATCNVVCTNTPITSCVNNDGCCPANCTAVNDNDCSASCGNGVIEGSETCDGNCPASCDDADACTTDVRNGASFQCNVTCSNVSITSCTTGDQCCPAGCTFAMDADCPCVPDTCASLGWMCGTIVDDGCGGGGEVCGSCNADEDCLTGVCEPNYRVGTACTSDLQCAPTVGVCLTEIEVGWSGGYCSRACTTDADCGGSNHCAPNGLCFKDCTSNADCRAPNYECFDIDSDGATECAPIGSGAGTVGSACTGFDDCAGGQQGYCGTPFAASFKDGYCLELCAIDADCPAGSHCSPGGVCLDTCASAVECRGNGYDCYDADGDARLECFRFANGAGAVGEVCTGLWDCAGGEFGSCALASDGWPGGYCTVLCGAGEGTCAAGTNCYNDGQSSYCLDNCQNVNQCRAGYQCADPGSGQASCIP